MTFFFSIIGIILYFKWKNDKTIEAKSALSGAIIGIIVKVILFVASIILMPIIRENSFEDDCLMNGGRLENGFCVYQVSE